MSTITFTEFKQIIKFTCRMKKDHNINIPVLIWGVHGIGKTEGIREIAEELNYGCVTLNLANQTPAELLGLQRIVDDVVKYFRPEWMLLDHPTPVVYFLDEILRGPTYVTQSMFNFINEGRLHTHKIRDYDVVVAASNPDTDAYNMPSFNDDAFFSRFAHLYLEPTVDEVKRHFIESGCHESIVSLYDDDAGLCKTSIPGENRVKVTPNNRNMKKVALMLNHMTAEELNTFGKKLIFALIGPVVGALEIAKLEKIFNIENPENILSGNVANINFKDVPTIALTNTKIIQHLKNKYNIIDENKPALKESQRFNLYQYIRNIPKDSGTAFLKELKLSTNEKLVQLMPKCFKGDIEYIMELMEV